MEEEGRSVTWGKGLGMCFAVMWQGAAWCRAEAQGQLGNFTYSMNLLCSDPLSRRDRQEAKPYATAEEPFIQA